jgi:hypothetical protein
MIALSWTVSQRCFRRADDKSGTQCADLEKRTHTLVESHEQKCREKKIEVPGSAVEGNDFDLREAMPAEEPQHLTR